MSPLPSRVSKDHEGRVPLRVLTVTGAYPTDEKPHSGTFIRSQVESLRSMGLDMEVLHPRAGPTVFRYVAALIEVRRKITQQQLDIVHGHYGLWCLVGRMQWATPVVASFLGDDLLGTVTASGSYSAKSRVVARISRWLSRHVDAVVVKSEQMSRLIVGSNVYVIPNGVDFDLFHPLPRAEARALLGWDEDRKYVLFGNDPRIPVKGFPLAETAIEHLRRGGVDATLVVATGLPQSALVRYMNASNVLLLTSAAEGSPNIVKEAMACNLPVVATDVGDVAQVIGRTAGCQVCSQDPEAVASGLAQALNHPGPTTGREDIGHLEQSVVAQRIIEVYDHVLKSRTRSFDVA
jgi:teichuronic acid biosynthesis glycosyltransferase TuaC